MAAKATQKPDGMNRSERKYAEHLEAERRAGRIKRWDREPEGLRLADRCVYWPDFRVVMPDDTVEFHEVKANGGKFYDPAYHYPHRDGAIKLKTASAMHPYVFMLIWPLKGGGWGRKAI